MRICACDGSRPRDAVAGSALIGTDNTARKQAEEALLKAGALQLSLIHIYLEYQQLIMKQAIARNLEDPALTNAPVIPCLLYTSRCV